MKLIFRTFFILSFPFLLFTACEKDETGDGTLNLSITDAPVDRSDIAGIFLTITEIQYHKNDSAWMTFEEYEGPQTFDILELTDGSSELLGSFEMDAGHYTQLRFIIDAPDEGMQDPANPGCYILFTDSTQMPLFVPSGSQTGWKGVGEFTVPVNGEVSVTADFSARKSVRKPGINNFYILTPTIRLIVNNQSGQIAGGLSNVPDGVDIIVYAYEDETFETNETDDPMDETETRFPNAVTSDIAEDTMNYHLSFLAPMTYDLVVASFIEGEFQEVLGIVEDVSVESNKTTNQPIDLSSL